MLRPVCIWSSSAPRRSGRALGQFMNTREQVPGSIRLLVAGIASLLLLTWTLIGRGLPPLIVPPGLTVSPWPILITALMATAILVILCPVVFRGKPGVRWVSIMLGVFPFLVLSVIVLWVVGVLQRGGL